MEKLVSFLWFRMLLFVASIFLSYSTVSWYLDLPDIMCGNGERLRCTILALVSIPIFFSIHTLFSLREKELLFTRPMCFFCILSFINLHVSVILGSLKFTEIMILFFLISEIIIYSIDDDLLLIYKKIENKKWEIIA